jgi:hypothetical protein
VAFPPKASIGETSAAAFITLSGMTLAERRVVPTPDPALRAGRCATRSAFLLRTFRSCAPRRLVRLASLRPVDRQRRVGALPLSAWVGPTRHRYLGHQPPAPGGLRSVAGARSDSETRDAKNVRGREFGKAPRSFRQCPPTRGSKSAEIEEPVRRRCP